LDRRTGEYIWLNSATHVAIMTELSELTLVETAELFTTRKLSPVELLDALLARIERLDPVYHVHILEMNGDSYRLKQSKARRSG